MMNKLYSTLLLMAVFLTACNDPEDVIKEFDPNGNNTVEELPNLTQGSADFSKYVSLGNSLTSGFSDGTVFLAAQQQSFPKIMSEQFKLVGGGDFTQPLVNDNFGGLALNGSRIAPPRLVTTGGPPQGVESVIGPVTVTTDIVLNNPTGPFNNMGVPLAKSFHLIAPGYGNIANFPTAANPYFIRMTGSTPDASVLELAMAQNPTFFSLWIGNNDVLGYARSGGDGTNLITDQALFDTAITALIGTLTSSGAKGVVANIPEVTDIAHFTTVPYKPLDPTNPDFGPQIPTLNTIFGALNQIFAVLDPSRTIVFSQTEASPVVINDETLTDLSSQITTILAASPEFAALVQSFGLPPQAVGLVAGLFGNAYGQARQTTEDDLLLLTSSAVIGTVNEASSQALQSFGLSEPIADQFSTEGITLPLADKWVLIPSEQEDIKTATVNFNNTIENAVSQAGLAFVDTNALLSQLASTGLSSNNFTLTSSLVTGGAFSLDGIHLTSRGYALVANEFLKAIDVTYGSNFEASGNLVDIGNYPTNYSPLLQ